MRKRFFFSARNPTLRLQRYRDQQYLSFGQRLNSFQKDKKRNQTFYMIPGRLQNVIHFMKRKLFSNKFVRYSLKDIFLNISMLFFYVQSLPRHTISKLCRCTFPNILVLGCTHFSSFMQPSLAPGILENSEITHYRQNGKVHQINYSFLVKFMRYI